MATFTSTEGLNIRWRGIWEFVGDAGTVFTIADDLYDEFNGEMASIIPGLTWVTTSDYLSSPIAESDVTDLVSDLAGKASTIHTHAESSVTDLTTDLAAKYDKTGGIISGSVTATGSLTAASLGTLSFSASASGQISGDSITTNTALFKGSPWYDVKAYGAVGDGTTDDTAAIQAAFDACHLAGGGTIYFPVSTYAFSSTLEMPYPASVLGDGPYSTRLLYTGGDGTAIRFTSYTTAEQRNGMLIQGFTLWNGGSGTSTIGMDLKGMCRSVVAQIRAVGWSSSAGYAFKVDASYGSAIGAWWNTFRDLETGYVGTGILFTGGGVNSGKANENRVVDCYIAGHSVAGVYVEWGDHVTIARSDFSSSQGGTGVISKDWQTVVRDCRFENNPTAIVFNASSGSLWARNIVEGCLFANHTTAIQINTTTGKVVIGSNLYASSVTTKVSDSGYASTDYINNYTANPNLVPIYCTYSNLAASLTEQALGIAGMDTSNGLVYVGRPYQIRGVSFRLSGSISTGSITVAPTISGTVQSNLNAVKDAGNVGAKWQGMGLSTNAGSGGIGCKVTTSSDWAHTTYDLNAVVWIEFTD